MYILIIALLCISHLSITASEQEQQAPGSPRAADIARPVTPCDEHVVTVHKRQSSLSRMAALSVATTASARSSISLGEPVSPQSINTPSSPAPLVVKTESPRHARPIHVSPKNEPDPNRRLFPAMYLTGVTGRIPVVNVDDDDDALSCRFYFLCGLCCAGSLVGVVLAIMAGASHGHPFN